MATYYFSATSGSNATGDGSQGNPWGMFKGKADGVQFLAAGDSCLFLRNDIWSASSAEVVVNSSGNSTNRIVIGAYGTGADPLFVGADTTALGWIAAGISSIYMLTGQNQVHLHVVTQGTDTALGYWRGGTNNLPAGTWTRANNIVYVHCWNDADPATSQVRVPTFAHSSTADGTRGLISSSRANGTRGSYVNFQNLKIVCSNGVGFSSSAFSNYFSDCTIVGAGYDGVLFYSELTGTGEDADSSRWIRGEIAYSAAEGTGHGQGYSDYAPRCWIVDALVHDNFMAGIDLLDFNANTNVTSSGVLRCTVYNNARWQDNAGSFDPQIYVDGGSECFIYGNTVYGAGQQPGSTNSKVGIAFGSEHPDTKPCENIWVINNLVYDCHWAGIAGDNAGQTTANILNVKIINNTVISYQAGGFEEVWGDGDAAATSGNWQVLNNVMISKFEMALYISTGSYLRANYNVYFSTNSGTGLYRQDDGFPSLTLAQWQAANGQDLASIHSSPSVILINDTSPNVKLKANSPAIQFGTPNPYVPPAWLPSDLFPYGGGVRGIARSDGTVDPGITALDAGFHFNSGDNFSTSNRVSISFNKANLKINRDAKLTLAVA